MITSPSSLNLTTGGTAGTVTAVVSSGLGTATINQMNFGSYNTSVANVNVTSDSTSPYSTTVNAVAVGSAAVWATAYLNDGRVCQSTGSTDTDITVANPTPTPTITPTPTPAPILRESFTAGTIDTCLNNSTYAGYNTMSFTASVSYKLNLISVPLRQSSTSPSTITASLGFLDWSGGYGGAITTLSTSTTTMSSSSLTSGYAWYNFAFPSYQLTAGSRYAIVMGGSNYYWQCGIFSSNPYPSGGALYISPAYPYTKAWSGSVMYNFKTYGP